MKTDLVDINDTRKNLRVEIPSAVVDEQIERVARNYSRQARIPGFRPGKAPARVIKQRYKDQILHDVAHELIPRAVDDALRERTRQILGVEVADNYGTTETFIAWQCPSGSYHVNAEHVFVELVDDAGRQVTPGETGRVVITTLENYLMPLIRYDIGDYAVAADGTCRCGRTLPRLGRVVGRKFNLFHSADGRLFSPALLIEPIRRSREIVEFQLVERTTDFYAVRYVADQELSGETESRISGEFHRLIGASVTVGFERVAEIARSKGGKFMAAISEIAQS